jgi:hypothetical protein
MRSSEMVKVANVSESWYVYMGSTREEEVQL